MTKSSVQATLLYFAFVMGTGFVLGAIRVPYLVPRLGERHAELLEMPLMVVAIVLAVRAVVRRFDRAPDRCVRLKVGFSALALIVCSELLLATVLQSRSLAEYVASRDPLSGAVYLGMLLLFACMPALLGWWGRGQNRRLN